MSWLNVRGKLYHCIKCAETVMVEYEGGACLTQIGDNRVYEQMALTKKYGQPASNPDSEGYYYHEEAICEDCFEKSHNQKGQRKHFEEIMSLCERLSEIGEIYSENIGKTRETVIANWLNSISLDECRKINKTVFDNTIGQKIFGLRGKRKDLIAQFVKNGRDSILSHIDSVIKHDESLQHQMKQYTAEIQPVTERIQALTKNLRGNIFLAKRINQPESLNDFVQYELTERTPVQSAPDAIFFFETVINQDSISEFLNACRQADQLEIDGDELIKEFQTGLENKLN